MIDNSVRRRELLDRLDSLDRLHGDPGLAFRTMFPSLWSFYPTETPLKTNDLSGSLWPRHLCLLFNG
jgi:hypothetical protein